MNFTISIAHHPVNELPDKFKTLYIQGLGACLSALFPNDARVKLVYDAWAQSISASVPRYWKVTGQDYTIISKSLSLQRDGLKFFYLRKNLLFDCMYILSMTKPRELKSVFDFVYSNFKGIGKRRAISELYYQWDNLNDSVVSPYLLKHRAINLAFQSRPTKKILVIATMSAGKSTLINALAGHRIRRMMATACTKGISYLYNKPSDDGVTFCSHSGELGYSMNKSIPYDEYKEIGIHFNTQLSSENICFVDSPGTNFSGNSCHKELTYSAINSNDYNAVLFVSNGNAFSIDDEDLLLSYLISHTKKPIIFVLNKLDCFNPEDDSIEDVLKDYYKSITMKGVHNPILVPISAEYALLSRLEPALSNFEYGRLKALRKLFLLDYYNLPKYYYGPKIHYSPNGGEIDKSGVPLLERAILTL